MKKVSPSEWEVTKFVNSITFKLWEQNEIAIQFGFFKEHEYKKVSKSAGKFSVWIKSSKIFLKSYCELQLAFETSWATFQDVVIEIFKDCEIVDSTVPKCQNATVKFTLYNKFLFSKGYVNDNTNVDISNII